MRDPLFSKWRNGREILVFIVSQADETKKKKTQNDHKINEETNFQ